MMRRLLLLFLLMAGALGGTCAPAAAGHPAVVRHAMPAGCHDEGTAVAHACLGCAVMPDAAAAVAPIASAVAGPRPLASPSLSGRSLGADPPPPRALA